MVPVEAGSLADINILAARPPETLLRHATYRKQEPLTLYISRVPGTRDIILSTFRPGLKNVTAEDVSSSMYYVHLELPALQELPSRSLNAQRLNAAEKRKPALAHAAHEYPFPNPIRRKPVHRSSVAAINDEPNRSNIGLTKPTKVLPPHLPTALFDSSGIENVPPLDPPPPIPSRHPRRSINLLDPPIPHPVELRPDPPSQLSSWSSSTSPADLASPTTVSSFPRSSTSKSAVSAPCTLLLIRREPYSSTQWNVGKITMREGRGDAADVLDAGHHHHDRPSPSSSVSAFGIQINTEGYAKFSDTDDQQRRKELTNPTDGSSLDSLRSEGQYSGFRREVTASYGKSWTSNLRGVFHWSHAGRKNAVSSPMSSHFRHGSAPRQAVESIGREENTGSHSHHGGDGMKVKSYNFLSPWKGRCEFRAADGGRIVRCTHTLDDCGNPLVEPGKQAVSELRFNMPHTEHGRSHSEPEKMGVGPAPHQVHGHFSKLLGTGYHDSSCGGDSDSFEEPVSPFELNLGKEHAGGGHSGKRAKLGKLVVYSEGLGMLDLVVAANIGVFMDMQRRE